MVVGPDYQGNGGGGGEGARYYCCLSRSLELQSFDAALESCVNRE